MWRQQESSRAWHNVTAMSETMVHRSDRLEEKKEPLVPEMNLIKLASWPCWYIFCMQKYATDGRNTNNADKQSTLTPAEWQCALSSAEA